MPAPRFIMIGGFLGAGKTTTMGRLARHYQGQGHRVVIVTNDQATDLVDTHLLRSQGFDVGEVAGSCFCCNFDALTETVERLGEAARPDVVLAEPVGSCTDLVATVIRPLEQVYAQPFQISPYGVIVKPSHGLRILQGKSRAGFSPQAEYIFRKQIEEADFIILNRIDELSPDQISELTRLIDEHYPQRPVVRMSAKTGEGFTALSEFLDQVGEFGQRVMDVDYEVYAVGEAELGWLNAQLKIQAEEVFDLDAFLVALLVELRSSLAAVGAETAHLKTIGMHEGYYAVANLVSSFDAPQLSLASGCRTNVAEAVINARVAIDPAELTRQVQDAIARVSTRFAATTTIKNLQSFKPGRPVPTHRI
ncbi:MAG: GTP-binding protein [Pirellulaceae bacterium]